MFDVDENGIITATRGDTGSLILFLNKGTQLDPIRFTMKNGLTVYKDSTLSMNSLLKSGSFIEENSIINGVTYNKNTTTKDDILIETSSTLKPGSVIHYDSILEKYCIINNKDIDSTFYVGRDEVYLGVMEPNQPFEKAILKKKFNSDNLDDDGDIVIRFEHDDTKCLLPGKYYYTIKAKFLNKYNTYDVNTVVQNTEFNIQE